MLAMEPCVLRTSTVGPRFCRWALASDMSVQFGVWRLKISDSRVDVIRFRASDIPMSWQFCHVLLSLHRLFPAEFVFALDRQS